MVIVHDAGSSSASCSGRYRSAATGYRILAWDLRGYGTSAPAPDYDVGDHLHDLAALLRHRDIARAHLVGHGAGSPIAAAFAADRPERVTSAVLVSTGETVPRGPAGRAVERAVGGALRVVRRGRSDPRPPALKGRLAGRCEGRGRDDLADEILAFLHAHPGRRGSTDEQDNAPLTNASGGS